MSKKQDRQPVRTARDLERKYDLGGEATAAQKYAASAAQSASIAQACADRLNEGLPQSQIVAALNGASSAFTIEGGVPYLNAAYIKGLQVDSVTAQYCYTGMVSGTLLPCYQAVLTKEAIAAWYNAGIWIEQAVRNAKTYMYLTDEDVTEILGEG